MKWIDIDQDNLRRGTAISCCISSDFVFQSSVDGCLGVESGSFWSYCLPPDYTGNWKHGGKNHRLS